MLVPVVFSDTATSRGRLPEPLGSLSSLSMIGIVLATFSGAIHLWLGLSGGKVGMIAAGVGFAVGIGAVLLDVRRETVVWLGISFTGGQIVLYALAHGFFKPGAPTFTPIGLLDKAVQVLLVGVLVTVVRRE